MAGTSAFRIVATFLLLAWLPACGGGGSSPDVTDAGSDDGFQMPDIPDIPEDTGPKDVPDVPDTFVPPECTPFTAATDCAHVCVDLGQCQICICNLQINNGTCQVVSEEDGISCDDGRSCSVADTCQQGQCVSGREICECEETADCALLDDGNPCTGSLVCDFNQFPYLCVVDPETVVTCDGTDDTFCSRNLCSPETGECAVTPVREGEECADDDRCSVVSTCQEGMCATLTPLDCSDDNPCTDNLCDPVLGCYTVANTLECDDGNPCTVGDQCVNRVCRAGSVRDCDDGDFCNGLETCSPLTGCVPGTAPNCDDGLDCTVDSCDPIANDCVHTWLPGSIEGPMGDPSCLDSLDNDCDGLVDSEDPHCLFGLTAVSPDEGPIAGGTELHLVGGSLGLALTVLIDGVPVEFTVLGDDRIRTVAPAHALGLVDIAIEAEQITFTLADAFRYTDRADVANADALFIGPSDPLLIDSGDTTHTYTGSVTIPEVTDIPEPQTGLVMAGFGYGARGTLPWSNPSWRWSSGDLVSTDGGAFTYSGSLTPGMGGYYSVAVRFSLDGGQTWFHGDLDGSANGYAPANVPDLTVFGRAVRGDIVINEIMWMGSDTEPSDEWIELRNITEAPIRLDGYRIRGAGYPQGTDFVLDDPARVVNNLQIEPLGYFLISQYEESRSAIAVQPDVAAQAASSSSRLMRLPDTAPWTYELVDSEGAVIDRTVQSGMIGFRGYQNPLRPSASMERRSPPGPGTTDADWMTAIVADGWKDDPFQFANLGTPRHPNSDIPLCSTDADCEDSFPGAIIEGCKKRACGMPEGRCTIMDVEAGAFCDDGLFCTVGETCQEGVCGGGVPRDCSDEGIDPAAACTIDSCDEDARSCMHSPDPEAKEGPASSDTCSDGIDNDCDGLTDGDDPQCILSVSSVEPGQISAAGGWEMQVMGTGLDIVTRVLLGNTEAVFSVVDPEHLSVISPLIAASGEYGIHVTDGVIDEFFPGPVRVYDLATNVLSAIRYPDVPLYIYVGNQTPLIGARVFAEGYTNGADPVDPGAIIAELGYGPDASNPYTNQAWQWFPSAFNVNCTECTDIYEYTGRILATEAGQFSIAFRFSVDGGFSFHFANVGANPSGAAYNPALALPLIVE